MKYIISKTILIISLFSFDVLESNIFVLHVICITKNLINEKLGGKKYNMLKSTSATFLNVLKRTII